MSRYTGNKSATQPKSGSQVWIGIVIGVVIGTGMATVFTWYLMKAPSPFLKKNPVAEAMKSLPPVATSAANAPSPTDTTDASNGKPRFEFYNVLTDKKSAKTAEPAKPVEKPKPQDTKPAVAYTPQVLQVGSFSSTGDAEKLKAKLAFIGIEAHIQTANVPDKGVWYRVRLGPYKSEDEMNRARSFLKQNDMDGTPMRAQ